MSLPSSIRAVIDRVIHLSGLSGHTAQTVRSDLEQHFRDGLTAGRTPEELLARFGDPATVAPDLARCEPPRSEVSDHRGEGRFAALVTDFRFAVRVLAKSPALTLTVMLVLALGVGANTVVFTVVNELLLRPLPVADQSELVDVWADIPGGNSFLGIAYQDFVTYRDENAVLEDLVAFTGRQLQMGDAATGDAAAGEVVVGQLVSSEYFRMLGITPTLGRMAFAEEELGGEVTVVLSHGFWSTSFGADPAIVGRTIHLDGHSATVVGVGPEGFSGHFIGFPSDLWLPIGTAETFIDGFELSDRSQKPFEMIGRVKPGVSPSAVASALNTIAQGIEEQYPDINRGHRVGVTPTTGLDHSLQGGVTAFVAVLTAVSGLVLLIACLNVGSLLLVRAMARDRELAIRLAIGAGVGRLLRQLMTETMILVVLGAILGTWLASRLNALLVQAIGSFTGGLGLDLPVDWRVLALTAAAAGLAAALASLAPAHYLLRKDPAGALRARGGGARSGMRLRTTLVVGQVAVSVVLLIATGLFVRALVEGVRANPGFDADRLAAFTLAVDAGEDAAMEGPTVQLGVLRDIEALPRVEALTVADGPLPGVARTPMDVEIPGVLPEPGQDRVIIDARTVGTGFFKVVGIPLRTGRDFTEADSREGPPVAIVSEAFVRRFWPQGDPLGRSFGAGGQEVRVVGVATDARYLLQDDTPDPIVYLSLAGRFLPRAEVILRAEAPLESASAVQELVLRAVPGHAPVRLRSAREALRSALLPQRLGSVIVGAMGLAALLLAAVGLYGLIQFSVTRDMHELGVRLALGGSGLDLLAVVFRKGYLLVAAGTALGVGIALVVTPGLSSFLGNVSSADPLTYGTVVAAFALVAAAASWFPARRAARIRPMEALRGE